MNIRRSAIAFVAIALLAASSALALDIPPKPTQWVNDYGTNTLSASQIQQLNEKLEGFYKKTGVQFLIMIFPSLEGEDELGYTNKVANMWKVKDEKALMLFVFMKEHRNRIQVSYNLEPVITDAFSSDVINNTLRPNFRAGDYAGGLNAAVDQIVGKIDPTAVGATSGPSRRAARSSKSPADMFFPTIFFLFVIFVLIPLLARGRRRGGCGGCVWPLFLGGWGGGGGTTFGGGGGGGGGWSTGGSWGGGGSSFGGGGAGGGW